MLIQPEDKKWNTNHHFEGLIDFCHVGKKNSIFLLVDSSYSSFYSSHQSHTVIELGQPVYVEVFVVKHKDKDLVLLLDDCWATRTRNPDDLQRWSLLKKGSLCFRLLRRTSVKKKKLIWKLSSAFLIFPGVLSLRTATGLLFCLSFPIKSWRSLPFTNGS